MLFHYTAEHQAPKSRERPDGDTVKVIVDLGMRVYHKTVFRLARIDAPELFAPGGPESRDFLLSLWPHGTSLSVTTFPDPTDKYGRWVAEVLLPNGSNLSDVMVSAGHAIYRNY